MKTEGKSYYDEREESEEDDEDSGNTFEHQEVDSNGRKVCQDYHHINPGHCHHNC